MPHTSNTRLGLAARYRTSRIAQWVYLAVIPLALCVGSLISPSVWSGQASVSGFEESLSSITEKNASPALCQSSFRQSATLNSPELFIGAARAALKKDFEGAVLLLPGQARSIADMLYFQPASDHDKQLTAELGKWLFFYLGGTGSPELYRDRAVADAIVDALRQWSTVLPEGYDPGWRSHGRFSQAAYSYMAAYSYILGQTLLDRRIKMSMYAALMADEAYFRAEQELNQLRVKNPNGFRSGDDDTQRANELREVLQGITAELESGVSDQRLLMDADYKSANAKLLEMMQAGERNWDSAEVVQLIELVRAKQLLWEQVVEEKLRSRSLRNKSSN